MSIVQINIHFESSTMGIVDLFDLEDELTSKCPEKATWQLQGNAFSPDYKKIMLCFTTEDVTATLKVIVPIIKHSRHVNNPRAEVKYPDNSIQNLQL